MTSVHQLQCVWELKRRRRAACKPAMRYQGAERLAEKAPRRLVVVAMLGCQRSAIRAQYTGVKHLVVVAMLGCQRRAIRAQYTGVKHLDVVALLGCQRRSIREQYAGLRRHSSTAVVATNVPASRQGSWSPDYFLQPQI